MAIDNYKISKKGSQGKLSESQRKGLFMVNVVSKVYERVSQKNNRVSQNIMIQTQ